MDKAYDRVPTQRSRELRTNATESEKRLWAVLRNRRLAGVRFNRQVPIGPYICDFVARSAMLVIEVDGGQHVADAGRDLARTRFLTTHGYRVIRFWNNEVLENIEGVVTVISQVLADMPSPYPSRNAGGESRP